MGILVAPYLLVREIRQQVDLWKTRTHTPLGGKAGGTGELRALIDRLGQYKEEAPVLRERLCQGVIEKLFTDSSSAVALASKRLLSDIIEYEGFLTVPHIDLTSRKLSTSELWETTGALVRVLDSFGKFDALADRLERLGRAILAETDVVEWKRQDGRRQSFLCRCTRFCLIRLSLSSAYSRRF